MKKIRIKSYFTKFLLYFIILLFVPGITIGFVYLTAERTVKKQILFASESTLSQFFNALDLSVEEMKDMCITVLNSEITQNYARTAVYAPDNTNYLSYVVKDQLRMLSGEKYYDVFAYYPYEDKLISGNNSALRADQYYTTYFKKYGVEIGQYQEVLQREAKKPKLFCLSGNNEYNRYFGVSMQQYSSQDRRQDFVVGVTLYPAHLKQLLSGMFSDEHKGNILIFDHDKKLLVSSNPLEADIQLEGEYESAGPRVVTYGEKKYMMHVQKSKVLDGYYALIVPLDYFWRQLSHLRIICGGSILLCMVISYFLAYWLTNKAYNPINSMLDRIQRVSKETFDKGQKSEFQYITEVLQKSINEKEVMGRKLRIQKDSQRERFLLSLMQGYDLPEQKTDDVFNEHGITMLSDSFAVAFIQSESKEKETGFDAKDTELLPMVFENVYSEIFATQCNIYLIAISPEEYVLLINCGSDEFDEGRLGELCIQGKRFLEESFRIKFTMSFSRFHNGLGGMKKAYEEANDAIRYRFIYGKGSFIPYSEVKERMFKYVATSDSKAAQMLTSFVEGNTKDKPAVLVLSEIMDMQGISLEDSIETIESFKLDMINTVNKLVLVNSIPGMPKGGEIQELLRAETFDDFKEALAGCMMQLKTQQESRIEQDNISKKAKEYIKEHYQDTQLNVSTLGNAMNISSWYLSKMFKEQYNITVLDYINKVRVTKAKELLKNTQMTVGEIAKETGFLSSNVFIKTFKKSDGITPGVYRTLLKKQ